MDTGNLRHRIAIETRAISRDSLGGVVEEWTPVATVWAEIVPLSGREFVAAQAAQAGVTTRITIRYRDGVTPSMRILHDGVTYSIKAVLPDPTLRRHITLMCEQGVNDG